MKTKFHAFLRLHFWVLILLFPLGHLTRFQLTPRIAIYFHDPIIASLNFFFLLYLFSFKPPLSPSKFFWLIPAFSFTIILSLLANQPVFYAHTPTALLYALRWLNLALLFPALYSLIKLKIVSLNTRNIVLSWSLGIALLGLIQYLFLPDTRFLFYLGWDDHLNRLISTVFDPAFTGLIILLGLILVDAKAKTNHWLLAPLLTALVLTYSRATYLTAIVAFLALAINKRSSSYLATRLVLLALLITLLPTKGGEGVNLTRTYSVTSRISTATSAWTIFSRHPLLGIGFNHYPAAIDAIPTPVIQPIHSSAPDNSYLFLLATTGLIGTSIYLLWQLKLITWSINHSLPLSLVTLTIALHSLTNNSLFYPFVSIWFWTFLSGELARHSK